MKINPTFSLFVTLCLSFTAFFLVSSNIQFSYNQLIPLDVVSQEETNKELEDAKLNIVSSIQQKEPKIKKIEKDDYGMMKEVLNRRFKKAIQEKDNYLSFPDLVLIDGGKGQYSTARETLNELGLHDIPIIAVAKGKFRNSGDETFFHNGKSFKFQKNDPTLFFLQRIRDEAHRFAISAHRAKRKKGISKSLLDQIEGIGSIRKRALLNHFGSARAVESASLDEIKTVEGVEEKVAKKIYNFFHE